MHVQPTTEPRTPSELTWFVDVVAHELCTPLAVARLAAQMLASGPRDDPDHDQLVETIERNTALATTLLERFRLAQNLEQQELQLQRRPLDLVTLVAESVEDLRPTILTDHQVVVRLPEEQLVVTADATAVREILSNLLVNAAKYSASGTEVEVSVAANGPFSSLAVADEGAGIRGSDIERIFDSYVQSDAAAHGFGLGLYLARGLARAQGGDLTVRAADGEGSTFTLDLPAAAASLPS
jgi:signal transduction histidine kinase